MELLISNLRIKRFIHPLKAVLGNHSPLLPCNDKARIIYFIIKKSLKPLWGSRSQQYRRRAELSCTAQFISPSSLLKSVTTSQRRQSEAALCSSKECPLPRNLRSGEWVLPTAAPDIWREYGVSSEQTVSYPYHYGLFLVRWWHGFGVSWREMATLNLRHFVIISCGHHLMSGSWEDNKRQQDKLFFFLPIYKGKKRKPQVWIRI